MANIPMIIAIIVIPLMVVLIAGAIAWAIYSFIRYRRMINTESPGCQIYSCGNDKSTTDSKCQPGADDPLQNPPMYAYRINTAGVVECQKDKAVNPVKSKAT